MDLRLASTMLKAIALAAAVGLVGCGEGGNEAGGSGSGASNDAEVRAAVAPPPDVSRAARGPLPEHNPDARYNGKTALEYAAELDDLNPQVQARALQTLSQFGVDALPAREKVKAVVNSNAPDMVKLGALSVLVDMQAPEAHAMLIEKLLDPDFGSVDNTYVDLMMAARKSEAIDDAMLRGAVLGLIPSKIDHATRLLRLERLPEPARADLMRAVFEAEHGEETVRYFMTRLTRLDFLDDRGRVRYIHDHMDIAMQDVRQTRQMLAQTGTEEAMDVALELGNPSAEQRYQLMVQFAGGKVDPEAVIRRLLEEAMASDDQSVVDLITAYMENVPSTVRQGERTTEHQRLTKRVQAGEMTQAEMYQTLNDAAGGPRTQAARAALAAGYAELIEDGPTEHHQSLGIARLMQFIRTDSAVELDALDPVLAVMKQPDVPEIVLGTALHGLRDQATTLAQRDRDRFYQQAADVLWAHGQPASSELIEQMWDRAVQWGTVPERGEHSVAAIDAILADLDDHLDQWAVNSAAVILTKLNQWLPENDRATRSRAAAALGKLYAGRQADHAYLQPHLMAMFPRAAMSRFMPSMVSLEHTDIDGVIAFWEAVIFAGHVTPIHVAMRDPRGRHNQLIGATFTGRINHVAQLVGSPHMAGHAEDRAKWRAFLQRVVSSGDADFGPHARTALQAYAQ